jgi:hypothetical protein
MPLESEVLNTTKREQRNETPSKDLLVFLLKLTVRTKRCGNSKS